MVKLILASNSPRRKKILSDLGLEFKVIPSNYDEKLPDNIFSYEKIEDLATQKCLDVVRRVDKDSLVLAADTVVVLHNRILGKPHSREEAYEMLKSLSGNTHSVVTAACGINTKTKGLFHLFIFVLEPLKKFTLDILKCISNPLFGINIFTLPEIVELDTTG